jgi:hypothetical protein
MTPASNVTPLTPAESWIMRSVPLDEWTTPVEAAPRLSRLADVERMSEWAYLYLETLADKGYVLRRTLTDGTPQYRRAH